MRNAEDADGMRYGAARGASAVCALLSRGYVTTLRKMSAAAARDAAYALR